MLYQLSYTRTWNQIKNGASDRNRTGDNHVGNVMLYQLSYTRTYATLSDDTIYDTAFLKFCKCFFKKFSFFSFHAPGNHFLKT